MDSRVTKFLMAIMNGTDAETAINDRTNIKIILFIFYYYYLCLLINILIMLELIKGKAPFKN